MTVVLEKIEFESSHTKLYTIKTNILNKQMLPKCEHVSSITLIDSLFTKALTLLMHFNYFNKTPHHYKSYDNL